MVSKIRSSRRTRFTPYKILVYALIVLGVIVSALPFYWMVLISARPLYMVFEWPPNLLPINLTVQAYQDLFSVNREIYYVTGSAGTSQSLNFSISFWRYFANSVIVSGAYTFLSLFFCSLGGFAFAKYRFPGQRALFAILLGSMMIPWVVFIVPLYMIVVKLHWVNTYWALIVPGMANAFGIFWMRQYISSFPDELIDAARIDGASGFRIYYRLIVPVSLPALAALGILFFMGQWNDLLWPLIVMNKQQMFTLPVFLESLLFGAMGAPPYHILMAGSFISVLPLVIIYLVAQRQFMAGIISGAFK